MRRVTKSQVDVDRLQSGVEGMKAPMIRWSSWAVRAMHMAHADAYLYSRRFVSATLFNTQPLKSKRRALGLRLTRKRVAATVPYAAQDERY